MKKKNSNPTEQVKEHFTIFFLHQVLPLRKADGWELLARCGPCCRNHKLAAHPLGAGTYFLTPSAAPPHWLPSRSWVHEALPRLKPYEQAVLGLECSSWQNPIHLQYQLREHVSKTLVSQIRGPLPVILWGFFLTIFLTIHCLLAIFLLVVFRQQLQGSSIQESA